MSLLASLSRLKHQSPFFVLFRDTAPLDREATHLSHDWPLLGSQLLCSV